MNQKMESIPLINGAVAPFTKGRARDFRPCGMTVSVVQRDPIDTMISPGNRRAGGYKARRFIMLNPI